MDHARALNLHVAVALGPDPAVLDVLAQIGARIERPLTTVLVSHAQIWRQSDRRRPASDAVALEPDRHVIRVEDDGRAVIAGDVTIQDVVAGLIDDVWGVWGLAHRYDRRRCLSVSTREENDRYCGDNACNGDGTFHLCPLFAQTAPNVDGRWLLMLAKAQTRPHLDASTDESALKGSRLHSRGIAKSFRVSPTSSKIGVR